jgi:acetylornithine deacetylase/succinyl-diaminopimelate desuccinylase-like protein
MARLLAGIILAVSLLVPTGASYGKPQNAAQTTAPAGFDLPRLESEAILWLQGLIRIDTTNPPGNDLSAAKYLAAILQGEGINSQVFQSGPNHGILVARLSATAIPNPSRALLLVGRLDTPAVNRSKWTVDPFAATIQDNFVYGPGAIDDKAMTVANLAVLVGLKRSNARLDRDVIFLATGGEQSGADQGMHFAVDKYWDQIAAGFAINEGGHVVLKDGKVQYVGIQVDEKVSRNLDVIATPAAGHDPLPSQDDPITHLAAAIQKIAAYQTPVQFNFVTSDYFDGLAKLEDNETAKWMRALQEPDRAAHAFQFISNANPEWGEMMRDTIAPTMLQAGTIPTAVPTVARGVVNLRILPGDLVETLVGKLQQAVNDPQVQLQIEPDGAPPAPASSTNSELFNTISETAKKQFPGTTILPYMSVESTDSAFLRERSVQTYGLVPFALTQEELARVQGGDERIQLDTFRHGFEFLYQIVTNFAVSQ